MATINNTTNGRTPAVASELHADNAGLTLTFADGGKLTVLVSELNGAMQRQCLLHGLKQKLVDAAAISRNPDTGRSATVADKHNAIEEVAARLRDGMWNKGRDAGSGTVRGGLLLRALVQMYDGRKTSEELITWLEGKTDAERAGLRKNVKIAGIIEELRAADVERKGGGLPEVDGLLSELDGDVPAYVQAIFDDEQANPLVLRSPDECMSVPRGTNTEPQPTPSKPSKPSKPRKTTATV